MLISKVIIHIASLAPLVYLVLQWQTDNLGFEPIKEATHQTGTSALIILLASLVVSPINQYKQITAAAFIRKTLGLYAFFYSLTHAFLFFIIDYELNPEFIKDAVLEKPYAVAGLLAFIILFILAVTSNRFSKKKLGQNWKRIHRLVYLAAAMVIVHYIWSVKSDYRMPGLYLLTLIILLIFRLPGFSIFSGKKPSDTICLHKQQGI